MPGKTQLAGAVLLASGLVAPLRAEDSNSAGAFERIARILSREVREAESRLDTIAEKLMELPSLHLGGRGSRYGYHSGTISDQEEAHWVQFDLGRRYSIDTVVAMPTHIATIETDGVGYGFPLRFTVEVADYPEMTNAIVAVDRSTADVENPGRYPMLLPTGPVAGRYVRFTSTRHVPSNEGFFWAMEELMVLSGNRNVAVGCEASASSQLELFPNWALERINDGLSALGMPVTAAASPTNGYLSGLSDQPTTEKWLVVDLGKEYALDEIRLFSAGSEKNVNPKGFPRTAGRPLPRHLAVEITTDPDFTEILWQRELSTEPFGYPWGSPVTMPCGGTRGRFVRFIARELWSRGKDLHNFALAELQAYAGDENVAFGKPVTTKDAVDRPALTRWAPEFAVDGFTSRHPLVEIPEYLELIAQRAVLEREQSALQALRDRKVRQTAATITVTGGGLGAVALLGWGWMLVRRKAVLRRDVARLREQIARDLHDDIGSNLGGIVLLSEMGSRHCGIGDEVRDDFETIKNAAEKTAESMQDIVWLIQPGSLGLRDLILRLRKSVEMIVGSLGVTVVVDPPEFRNRELTLLFRRHFYFAFKETLNNVRKHAAATRVEVKIELGVSDLAFTVRDDGKGFDPNLNSGCGHGLNNLRRRAERLKGICHLESEPGRGTRVYFKAPVKA